MCDCLQLRLRIEIKCSIITDYEWSGNGFESELNERTRYDFITLSELFPGKTGQLSVIQYATLLENLACR